MTVDYSGEIIKTRKEFVKKMNADLDNIMNNEIFNFNIGTVIFQSEIELYELYKELLLTRQYIKGRIVALSLIEKFAIINCN